MNQAIKFIQEHGLEYATDVVKENKTKLKIFSTFEMDLKRLVESHELVMDYYGLTRAKEHAESNYTAPELKDALKQAIADVESCMEVPSESN